MNHRIGARGTEKTLARFLARMREGRIAFLARSFMSGSHWHSSRTIVRIWTDDADQGQDYETIVDIWVRERDLPLIRTMAPGRVKLISRGTR